MAADDVILRIFLYSYGVALTTFKAKLEEKESLNLKLYSNALDLVTRRQKYATDYLAISTVGNSLRIVQTCQSHRCSKIR